MARFSVAYQVRDRDDKRDETEHDIEAQTPGAALLAFFMDQGIDDDDFDKDLLETVTLGDLAEAIPGGFDNGPELEAQGWTPDRTVYDWAAATAQNSNGTPSLDFSDDHGRIISVWNVSPEVTKPCPTCAHSGEAGRVAIEAPSPTALIEAVVHVSARWESGDLAEVVRSLTDAAAAARAAMPPRVLVTVEDGVAVGVAEGGAQLVIMDYDVDGVPEAETLTVRLHGEDCRYALAQVSAWNADAEALWELVNA